jgi:hypothetical protein
MAAYDDAKHAIVCGYNYKVLCLMGRMSYLDQQLQR